jgi:hypothetical protein
MRRFFENRMIYAAVVLLFALAFAWNLSHSAYGHSPSLLLVDPAGANGMAVPAASPNQVRVASGPTMPPPPWEEVRVASGPTMPPPPWEEGRVTA